MFPDLLSSVDSSLVTYDFNEFASCVDACVERYRKWEILHAERAGELPFYDKVAIIILGNYLFF